MVALKRFLPSIFPTIVVQLIDQGLSAINVTDTEITLTARASAEKGLHRGE